MEPAVAELWEQILERARISLPEQSFTTWLAAADVVSWAEGVLHIAAPSRFHAEWLEDKYGGMLSEIARGVAGQAVTLSVTAAGSVPNRSTPELSVAPVVESAPVPGSPPQVSATPNDRLSGLNQRYTFGRFIVGEHSRLAQAASLSVAERPARSYNPLFLYGATGLGKTHLMHAIANRTLESRTTASICYLPAEQFVNEMVTAIYQNRTDAFRARYRSYDLLLVDDVQFLRGKEHTQEEFFHTFNVLYNSDRQIVLTSDRHPKDLEGLEERLVSRFEWGLVAEISQPDYETRVAILRKKADEENVHLSLEVLDLVACFCTSSVRELEGAIIKLLALSSVTDRDVTPGLARAALAGVGSLRQTPPLGPELIRDEVAEAWGATTKALVSHRRSRNIVIPRQVAMFLMRELLDLPLAQIGKYFGGRDHSTVIHSIRKVERQLGEDAALQDRVDSLRKRLSAIPA